MNWMIEGPSDNPYRTGLLRRALAMAAIAVCIAGSQNASADQLENAKLAAQRGDEAAASARIGLGLMYLYGSGVERDHVRALMWFKLAAAAEHSGAAKYYDHIAARMTPLQIARAQALAEICLTSDYTECD